jgi:predicted acylesterase/phospholipase RssA
VSGKRPKVGLIMTGGGARAADQVGVLRALTEQQPADAQSTRRCWRWMRPTSGAACGG